jgi:hypothetical protein
MAAISERFTGAWFDDKRRCGYDTNGDTNPAMGDAASLEVVEKMVGPWGLEPQTSTVSR